MTELTNNRKKKNEDWTLIKEAKHKNSMLRNSNNATQMRISSPPNLMIFVAPNEAKHKELSKEI